MGAGSPPEQSNRVSAHASVLSPVTLHGTPMVANARYEHSYPAIAAMSHEVRGTQLENVAPLAYRGSENPTYALTSGLSCIG